jgi:glucan phosphoethanolaminetransferase (alkaline phosphatase superfamily)
MEPSDHPFTAAESRTMLGHLIIFVVSLLTIGQWVIFIGFRWMNVRMDDWYRGGWIDVTINPWLIWIPAGMVMLAVIWWASCRKYGRRWHWVVLILCIFMGGSLAAITYSMEKPRSPIPKPDGPQLPKWEDHFPKWNDQSPMEYPFQF